MRAVAVDPVESVPVTTYVVRLASFVGEPRIDPWARENQMPSRARLREVGSLGLTE